MQTQTERESKTEHTGSELVDMHQPHGVVKRKRTKRLRHHHHPPASSASSSESTTTEEEDMAHCLILLAQSGAGGAADSNPSPPAPQPPAAVPTALPQQAQPSPPTTTAPPPSVVVKSERYTSRKYTEAATTADGVKAGFYVYECRTCNKCFPTFQALGGHRASHKKPRLLATTADDEDVNNASKQPPPMMTPPPPPPPRVFPDDVVTTALSLNNNSHVVAAAGSSSSSKLRVHECSVCGTEFASGQALGGHMRRHRPLNAPPERAAVITTMDATKKQGGINLELDLNLPAPSDDPAVVLGLGQFNDGNNKAGLMLTTASALVDCHY